MGEDLVSERPRPKTKQKVDDSWGTTHKVVVSPISPLCLSLSYRRTCKQIKINVIKILREYQVVNRPPSPGSYQIYQAVLKVVMWLKLKLMILLPHPLECQDTNYRCVPTHQASIEYLSNLGSLGSQIQPTEQTRRKLKMSQTKKEPQPTCRSFQASTLPDFA